MPLKMKEFDKCKREEHCGENSGRKTSESEGYTKSRNGKEGKTKWYMLEMLRFYKYDIDRPSLGPYTGECNNQKMFITYKKNKNNMQYDLFIVFWHLSERFVYYYYDHYYFIYIYFFLL